jgi:hypothetical protein
MLIILCMIFFVLPKVQAQVTFSDGTSIAVGANPINVAIGDFNADGRQDLVASNANGNSVSILLGNGDGTFSTATNLSVTTSPVFVAVGEFNADGHQDLVVLRGGSANMAILLGNGSGGFGTPVTYNVGISPQVVSIGDFNEDGNQDLAVARFGGTLAILLGSGSGTFSAPVNYSIGSNAVSVTIGDFNADGNQDLAATNHIGNTLSVLLGNGDGTFNAATNYATSTTPYSVSVGDFNADGQQDLVTANFGSTSNTVSVFLGNGDGTFGAAVNFSVGNQPRSVAVGDINADGRHDIITANFASASVSVLVGNGSGGFSAPTNFSVGSNPIGIVVGDVNADARQDLFTANLNSNNVSVLLNSTPGTPVPTAYATRSVVGNGVVEFAGTGVSIAFSGYGGIGGVVSVGYYNTVPANVAFSGTPPANRSSYRFVISHNNFVFGSAEVRFNRTQIPDAGIGSASNVIAYRRAVIGSGAFQALPNSFNPAFANEVRATSTAFSEFILGSNTLDNPLPVELQIFSAQATDNGNIRLQWRTATETDNVGFLLRRSTDSLHYHEIASYRQTPSLRGRGTSTASTDYTFTDRTASAGKNYYQLYNVDLNGTTHSYRVISVFSTSPANRFRLEQNYPNPFNPTTEIRYQVSRLSDVRLEVFDMLGRNVSTLVNQPQAAGMYQVMLNASHLSSGVYFYRLQAGQDVEIKKMLLCK